MSILGVGAVAAQPLKQKQDVADSFHIQRPGAAFELGASIW